VEESTEVPSNPRAQAREAPTLDRALRTWGAAVLHPYDFGAVDGGFGNVFACGFERYFEWD
jgi:hypothetical protein